MWNKHFVRFFGWAMLLMIFSGASLFDDPHLARVQKIEGVPVYLLADPVRAYEIVEVLPMKRNSYSVRQTLLQIVLKIKKLEEKEKIGEYDALLVSETMEEVSLIRYSR
ncbi:MAG: hypothetical protein ACFCUI_03755 [Bernardetiaceae bacterium]